MKKIINQLPLVSIGIPTYNRPLQLEKVLQNLILQNYHNIEIIISDNFSENVLVESLCRKLVRNDPRIRYFRQTSNIGPAKNFKFVLDKAIGKYFMWSADDDLRSFDFVKLNVDFLENNENYVASMTPNALVDNFSDIPQVFYNFEIKGSIEERFHLFIKYSMFSHGIFYALCRTEMLKTCTFIGNKFFAADWAIDLHIISKGPINRVNKGFLLSKNGGISQSEQRFSYFRNNLIDYFLPFHTLLIKCIKLTRGLKPYPRLIFYCKILSLNKIYYIFQLNKYKSKIKNIFFNKITK